MLPWAQQQHELDVLADFEVERITADRNRAVGVLGRHRPSGEQLSIAADEIVIAAGPIGSSWLLQRSGLGGDRVGEGLHFNINSPLTADFPDPVDAFAGIQMSHAYIPDGGGVPGYLVETWFNPPATQALAMPGWFDHHFANMERYRHMACAGVLVGTTTPGRVKATRNGPEIEYTASAADRGRVVEGLGVAGRIWLHAGAERVMPATFSWQEYRTAASLDGLASTIRETGDLLMTSAHPQGGNAIGDVVDEDFRVRGFANLFLCDASVFPTSLHVNPQLTVMGHGAVRSRPHPGTASRVTPCELALEGGRRTWERHERIATKARRWHGRRWRGQSSWRARRWRWCWCSGSSWSCWRPTRRTTSCNSCATRPTSWPGRSTVSSTSSASRSRSRSTGASPRVVWYAVARLIARLLLRR